jgi:hypothetical protein
MNKLIAQLQQLLWPNGDAYYEWDSGTLDSVANALINAGHGPSSMKIGAGHDLDRCLEHHAHGCPDCTCVQEDRDDYIPDPKELNR